MNLERGFRRLFVVLSVEVVGLGLALDAGKLWSHAMIYVTTSFEETLVFETWTLVGSRPYEQDPRTRRMVQDLLRMPINHRAPVTPGTGPRFIDPLEGGAAVLLDPAPLIPDSGSSLRTFRVVRGPGAWSWEDVRFTPIAGGMVVLLWAGFFGLRWVTRGFTS